MLNDRSNICCVVSKLQISIVQNPQTTFKSCRKCAKNWISSHSIMKSNWKVWIDYIVVELEESRSVGQHDCKYQTHWLFGKKIQKITTVQEKWMVSILVRFLDNKGDVPKLQDRYHPVQFFNELQLGLYG